MKKHLLKRVLSLGLTLGFFTTGLFGACDRKTGNGLEPEQEDIAVSSVKAVGSPECYGRTPAERFPP